MFLRLEISFDLFTYINRLGDGINLRSLSWCLTAFADCRSLNSNAILIGTSCNCSSDTVLFRTYILSSPHFDKMSDGVLYAGFGIMEGNKSHFKTFPFLMEELPFR